MYCSPMFRRVVNHPLLIKKRAGTAFGGPGSRFQVYGLGAGPENEGTAVADNNEDEEKLCVERYIQDSHYDPLLLSKNLKYGAFRVLRRMINPFSPRVKHDFSSLSSDSDTVIPEAGQGKCHPSTGPMEAKSSWNADESCDSFIANAVLFCHFGREGMILWVFRTL